MNGITIELAPFEIRKGTGDEPPAAASRRLETEFLGRAEGYLGRMLLRQGDGRFLDLVIWRSREHADRAGQAATESEACRAYFACMADADHAEPGAGIEHYQVVEAFGAAVAALTERQEAA